MKDNDSRKVRIPKSTRPIQIHKDANDYDRKTEREEVLREMEESE